MKRNASTAPGLEEEAHRRERQAEDEVAAGSHQILLYSSQVTLDIRSFGESSAAGSLEAKLAIRHTADTEGSTAQSGREARHKSGTAAPWQGQENST